LQRGRPAPRSGSLRPNASWFLETFGFKEPKQYGQAQTKLREVASGSGNNLCLAGYRVGEWQFANVQSIRQEALDLATASGCMEQPFTLVNFNGDVRQLHQQQELEGSTFQAASQANCLEMRSRDVTPEDGVTVYWMDATQGPAVALSCGAACAFRNYLVPMGPGGQEGQTKAMQLDSMAALCTRLSGDAEPLWWSKNGYVDSSDVLLARANTALRAMDDSERSEARDLIAVGLHFDCEVTLARHCVAQVFCSALPVSRSKVQCRALWQPLAELVLEAVYEATLWAHVVYTARFRTANGLPARPVFLTQVGGGVFGNEDAWICKAIERACHLVKDQGLGLDVRLVHYGGGTPMGYSLLEGRCKCLCRKEGVQTECEGES